MTILEQDAIARKRITQEINANFFVEAAAGSGKTSSLVDRMTAMVGAGIEVGEICAITFTKAAAKEFYSRFQTALIKYSRNETDETRRERYANALRNIDLCFMGTIDAFSNMLLHEHPAEAGIPSETSVCSESEAAAAYLAEYARIKRGEYGGALLEKYERFCAVQDKPDEVFVRMIGRFTGRREAEFVYSPPEDMDINTRFADWKYELVLMLNRLQQHPEYQFTGRSKESAEAWSQLQKHSITLHNSWNDQISKVMSAMKKLTGLRLKSEPKGKVLRPDMIGAELPDVFRLHNGRPSYYCMDLTDTDAYRALKKLQYAATIDFLVTASAAISEEICRKGTMTFHDALLRLRNLLKTDAANGGRLIRHIAKRHRYYLIDEFQDTDPMQAEVMFYLAANTPQKDWTACEPRPGALFIVGDPKQSIYRFRSADVASFRSVRDLFANGAGEVLTLSKNFRSTRRLCKMFNAVFPSLLQENGSVQSGYHPIPVDETEADAVSTGVYTYPVLFDRSPKDDEEQLENVIRRLAGNPAIRLKDGKPPQFRDIMIITYWKTNIAKIAKRLSAAGIPVRVEGKINLAECPALHTAADLFAAAASPTDAMSVYRALVSPAFCISHEMICDYCSIGGWLSAYCDNKELLKKYPAIADSLEKYPAIRNALETIRKYADFGYSTDSAALFQKISDEAKLFAKTGSASMEYYCYAVELLRKKENAGELLHHADAAEYLRNLLKGSGEERCVSLLPDDNRVHIANLHKVKGLQAPIVILADPGVTDFDPDLRLVHGKEKTECRVFRLHYRTQNHITLTYAETDQFSADWIDEAACMTAEKERLLYVAATRAESILIIGDSMKADGERCEQNPWKPFLKYADGTVQACIAENTKEITVPETNLNGYDLYAQSEKQSLLKEKKVCAPSYETVRPSQIRLKAVAAEETEDTPEREPLDRNAALTGTLVHKLMECIVSGGLPDDADMLISSILREFDADDAVYRPLLEKVLETVTHGGCPQEDDVPEDLLAVLRQADEVYCEVPFCLKRGSEIVNGVIDLLYRCGDAWQIIDYKTNDKNVRLGERYAPQLTAYTEAVRELIGAEAKAGIYHIDV